MCLHVGYISLCVGVYACVFISNVHVYVCPYVSWSRVHVHLCGCTYTCLCSLGVTWILFGRIGGARTTLSSEPFVLRAVTLQKSSVLLKCHLKLRHWPSPTQHSAGWSRVTKKPGRHSRDGGGANCSSRSAEGTFPPCVSLLFAGTLTPGQARGLPSKPRVHRLTQVSSTYHLMSMILRCRSETPGEEPVLTLQWEILVLSFFSKV